MDFEGQRSGEEVLFIFRRHIVTAWKGLVFMLVMIGLGYLPVIMWPELKTQMYFVWAGVGVIGLLGFLKSLILWHFSFYMVTNQRLRQVRQKGIFTKTVVDLDLDRIQSTSFGVHGVFATMFNYGTILVQTGAGDLILSAVSKPESVYNELENAVHNERKDSDE
jgi:uncharacterized membrane protein YdbT with pleckstrin-like domain